MTLAISVVSVLATLGLLYIAYVQVETFREEAIKNRTLDMCFVYDSDPVIAPCVETLRKTEEGEYQKVEEHVRLTLLNYFEVLAIGVYQGNYDFDIVYSQFIGIIPYWCDVLDVDQYEESYIEVKKLRKRMEERQTRKPWWF